MHLSLGYIYVDMYVCVCLFLQKRLSVLYIHLCYRKVSTMKMLFLGKKNHCTFGIRNALQIIVINFWCSWYFFGHIFLM